jgi:hypothetical protein
MLKMEYRTLAAWITPRIVSCLVGTVVISQSAFGVVYFTLSGSQSQNNVPYQTYVSRAGSASMAVDMGEYFRIGYTHRQEFSNNYGFKTSTTDPSTYTEFLSQTKVVSNSIDLNIILYAGDLFIPYLSAGAVVKTYYSAFSSIDGAESASITLPPVPNLGGGVGVRLSRSFSLKLSYTVSPGVRQEPGGIQEGILDTYSSLGITYQL